PLAVHHLWAVAVVIFAIGCGGALGTILQTRLMDVAGEAQSLAAALNHSAFNTANALGPLLGGMAIAQGYGWASTGFVGAALALGGLLILIVAMRLEARDAAPQHHERDMCEAS
ncbi:MAG TPA: MFS transporter, partial [Sphingobium sp.]|uniref:MFS transporter n=1 Tax=Sphingobium sp. TaxID=1912891 RepID=UPI002ED316E6